MGGCKVGGEVRAVRTAHRWLVVAALLCAPGVSACGSAGKRVAHSTRASGSSSSTLAAPGAAGGGAPVPSQVHRATLTISSSAPYLHGGIEPRYTCHGQDISPPVKWRGLLALDPSAKEVLFLVRTVAAGKVSTDWAVAGLAPKLGGINAGEVPPGAVVGRNSSGEVGYRLCPPANALLTMAVYAVGHKLSLKPGFDPESIRSALDAAETQWGGLTFSAYPPPK
jgi:phosphatidylethanolamine-binding protein (PEBP) family uncharacterized protein